MEKNMMEYLKNNMIGNVRSGTRGEKDNPIKLAYFDVHTDKSTPALAVEIFNDLYKKPTSLKIKLFSKEPMIVGFQKYEGKKLKCFGNGREARVLEDKKRESIQCDGDNCQYCQKNQCKKVGRLYFYIQGLEDEGVWCFPTGSQKGIRYILRRIERANRIGEDLTKDWYELYLRAEDTGLGRNYIPDIRKLEDINNQDKIEEDKNKQTNISSNKQENKNQSKTEKRNTTNNEILMLVKREKAKYKNQEIAKFTFVNPSSEKKELFLLPECKQDILKVGLKSIIQPIKISKIENNAILNDYKILKVVENDNENKKAV